MTTIQCIALALFFAACGPNLAFMAERSRSEALALQDLCRKSGTQGQEIAKADAFLDESAHFWKDGDSEKARLASEDAASIYRLVLARAEKEKADKELAEAESALAKDKERLATYREILDEMKTMRKP